MKQKICCSVWFSYNFLLCETLRQQQQHHTAFSNLGYCMQLWLLCFYDNKKPWRNFTWYSQTNFTKNLKENRYMQNKKWQQSISTVTKKKIRKAMSLAGLGLEIVCSKIFHWSFFNDYVLKSAITRTSGINKHPIGRVRCVSNLPYNALLMDLFST